MRNDERAAADAGLSGKHCQPPVAGPLEVMCRDTPGP
jgi:hypothetical protein